MFDPMSVSADRPATGTLFPTRRELADLIKEIVVDAAGVEGTVSQPLAERLAQYLDAIYPAADRPVENSDMLDRINASRRERGLPEIDGEADANLTAVRYATQPVENSELRDALRDLEEKVEVLGVAIGRDPEISAAWCRARNEEIDTARSKVEELFASLQRERDTYHEIVESYIRIGSVEECQWNKAELARLRADRLTNIEADNLLYAWTHGREGGQYAATVDELKELTGKLRRLSSEVG